MLVTFGNTYTSKGVGDFFRTLFKYHQKTALVNIISGRAGSDFATSDLYKLC